MRLINHLYKNSSLPNFLCIGAQKAGTTWLYQMLLNHPELYVPGYSKELHFFDRNFVNGMEWYKSYFWYGKGRIKGEITPNYATLEEGAVSFISRIMPFLKVIYIFRNPIDRAWSHLLMDYTVNAGREFESLSKDEVLNHFNTEYSRSNGSYYDNVIRWQKFIPKHRIVYGYYEEIKDNPEIIIKRFLDHLGVESSKEILDKMPLNEVVFQGNHFAITDEYYNYLYEMYRPQMEKLYNQLGNEYILNWYKDGKR